MKSPGTRACSPVLASAAGSRPQRPIPRGSNVREKSFVFLHMHRAQKDLHELPELSGSSAFRRWPPVANVSTSSPGVFLETIRPVRKTDYGGRGGFRAPAPGMKCRRSGPQEKISRVIGVWDHAGEGYLRVWFYVRRFAKPPEQGGVPFNSRYRDEPAHSPTLPCPRFNSDMRQAGSVFEDQPSPAHDRPPPFASSWARK